MALTDNERIERVKTYRGIIEVWKRLDSDGYRDDIRDLEAWINKLNGPADNDAGRKRTAVRRLRP